MNRRRMSLFLAFAAVFGLAALGWLLPLSRNSQAAPAPSSDASFKGKVLLVHTNNMLASTFILERAQVQKIGDHSFLVGKGAVDGQMGGWYNDRTVRLQMEHIIYITEFDDLKDAKKAMESGGVMVMGGIFSPSPVPPGVAPAAPAPIPAVPALPGKR